MKSIKQIIIFRRGNDLSGDDGVGAKDGKDKPPPKAPPPTIPVQPKPTPDKPKKPDAFALYFRREED